MYDYRARYHDPNAGRFISEDFSRFGADVNFYRYVGNSPVQLIDPLGLFPTPDHWQWTYDLARAAFGPKCEDKARRVADANAAEDDLPTLRDKVQFFTFRGEGWRSGGPHFPTPQLIDDRVQQALNTCSLKELGKATHSIQDKWGHANETPLLHFLTGKFTDMLASTDASSVNGALEATSSVLLQFKSRCLKCCQ